MDTGDEPHRLLVIECQRRIDWRSIFQGCTVAGQPLAIEQATWSEVRLCTYHQGGAILKISNAMAPSAPPRTFRPTFVLMRSVTKSIPKAGGGDSRNLVYGLQLAGLPAVNSLASVLWTLERVVVHAELKRVQQRLGGESAFPLISQDYYPSHADMMLDPGFPCVVKVGGVHSGFGKILVHDRVQWNDVKSLVALHDDYATAEPYIQYDYELRLQQIGAQRRALKRYSSTWKGNTSVVSVEEVPMTTQYERWLDAASGIFGGLDICALDVVHSVADDRFIILELNDTAIGLAKQHEESDHGHIRDLTLVRMAEAAEEAARSSTADAMSAASAASEHAPAEAPSLSLQMQLQGAVAAREKAEARLQEVELKVMHGDAPRAKARCVLM